MQLQSERVAHQLVWFWIAPGVFLGAIYQLLMPLITDTCYAAIRLRSGARQRCPDVAWPQTASSDLRRHLTNLSGPSSPALGRSARVEHCSVPPFTPPSVLEWRPVKLARLIIGPPLVRDVTRTTPIRIGNHSVSVNSIECAIFQPDSIPSYSP